MREGGSGSAGDAQPSTVGDEGAFAALTERHRRELHVHCYRMLGSFDRAEDLVQETFLRAWRRRASFTGPAEGARPWLYRIATNACLDRLALAASGEVPVAWGAGADPTGRPPSPAALPWLQPYPDRLLDEATGVTGDAGGPAGTAIARETIELAYVAALQVLQPRQRAVLLLRDVLGWPAADTAGALGLTTDGVNSTLRRARATLRRHLPAHRVDWPAAGTTSEAERAAVTRFVDACEAYDVEAVVALALDDIRMTAPPDPRTWQGRAAFAAETEHGWGPAAPGVLRCLVTRANRQPAVATYLRPWDDTAFRPFVLSVLRVEGGGLAEITMFETAGFDAFDLPALLPSA